MGGTYDRAGGTSKTGAAASQALTAIKIPPVLEGGLVSDLEAGSTVGVAWAAKASQPWEARDALTSGN